MYNNPTFENPFSDHPEVEVLGQASGAKYQPQKLLEGAVNQYYDQLFEDQGYVPPDGRDTTKFNVDENGRLSLKADKNKNIVNSRTGKPLSLKTVNGYRGGGAMIRELGFPDGIPPKEGLPQQAVEALQIVSEEISDSYTQIEHVPMNEMSQVVENVRKTVENTSQTLEKILIDSGTEADYQYIRELNGLDEALQTIRGNIVVQESNRHSPKRLTPC